MAPKAFPKQMQDVKWKYYLDFKKVFTKKELNERYSFPNTMTIPLAIPNTIQESNPNNQSPKFKPSYGVRCDLGGVPYPSDPL